MIEDFGYTLHDLHQFARSATRADRALAADYATRYGLAWSGIVDVLIDATDRPEPAALVRAGWQAIYRDARTSRRGHGYQDDGTIAPRFTTYWGHRVAPSPEGRIVDRMAVQQVIAALPDRHRDAIAALAVADNYQAAADLMDVSYPAAKRRIAVARHAALALWHDGETPHQRPGSDRRVASYSASLATHCRLGHEYTPENTRWGLQRRGATRSRRRWCRTCERQRVRVTS